MKKCAARYFLTQPKNGTAVLEPKRELGISYNSAWPLKHKLMQAMKERDDSQSLRGYIQLDDAYMGGECRGHAAPPKTPFSPLFEPTRRGIRSRCSCPRSKGSVRGVAAWAQRHLQAASIVVSDGLSCFTAVKMAGCEHETIITGGGPASVENAALTWVNTMIGNVNNSIQGTYHGIGESHVSRYLTEF